MLLKLKVVSMWVGGEEGVDPSFGCQMSRHGGSNKLQGLFGPKQAGALE